ncbi:MAG: DsbA family protein [Paracoccaceae bacterium]|nr:DsbA family protein [Paracoccaceae bacterium]
MVTLTGLGFGAVALLPAGAARAQDAPAADAPLPEVPDMVMGNPDAKVTLLEYASFTCPHCANFHTSVFKPLKADYIDTGKVKFIYREVYFDRYGLWAAMVARCGGEMRYFGISDILLSTQSEWAHADDATVVVENLRKIGRKAGMDDATLTSCLEDGAMAQAMVATYQANATADAVEGTPTLIINGVKHPNMSYADLKKILDTELAK